MYSFNLAVGNDFVNFITSVLDILKYFGNVLENFFKNIWSALNIVSSLETYVGVFGVYLPTFISSMFLVVVGFSLINYIIGR